MNTHKKIYRLGSYTIQELQSLLQFQYLKQNAYPEEIRIEGWEKWKRGEVNVEAIKLGERFKEQILSAYIPQVSVRFVSDFVGFGLFAEEKIEPGAYVGEYTGTIRKNNQRYLNPLNHYCYEYPLERNFVIDATCGNLTRFINHSYEPNLQPKYAFFDGLYHVIFIARQAVQSGEQLCYNYGKNYWQVRQQPKELESIPSSKQSVKK